MVGHIAVHIPIRFAYDTIHGPRTGAGQIDVYAGDSSNATLEQSLTVTG